MLKCNHEERNKCNGLYKHSTYLLKPWPTIGLKSKCALLWISPYGNIMLLGILETPFYLTHSSFHILYTLRDKVILYEQNLHEMILLWPGDILWIFTCFNKHKTFFLYCFFFLNKSHASRKSEKGFQNGL